jgi:hypothetical protein
MVDACSEDTGGGMMDWQWYEGTLDDGRIIGMWSLTPVIISQRDNKVHIEPKNPKDREMFLYNLKCGPDAIVFNDPAPPDEG